MERLCCRANNVIEFQQLRTSVQDKGYDSQLNKDNGFYFHYPFLPHGGCLYTVPQNGYTATSSYDFLRNINHYGNPVNEENYDYLIPILKQIDEKFSLKR